jgi:uncharacterized protein (TIGR03086 family)
VATEGYEQAIASTRDVLANVSADQLDAATPCTKWSVKELVNHIVGGQYFFAGAMKGDDIGAEPPDFASGDFLAAYDDGAKAAVAAFQADGALDQTLTLPFGEMPGAAFLGLATTDTFTHGWDLAKATGQNTDLNPALAQQLLDGPGIPDGFRSEDGAVFGLAQHAPDNASTADRWAAYMGRNV